jgi:hypothetical protein
MTTRAVNADIATIAAWVAARALGEGTAEFVVDAHAEFVAAGVAALMAWQAAFAVDAFLVRVETTAVITGHVSLKAAMLAVWVGIAFIVRTANWAVGTTKECCVAVADLARRAAIAVLLADLAGIATRRIRTWNLSLLAADSARLVETDFAAFTAWRVVGRRRQAGLDRVYRTLHGATGGAACAAVVTKEIRRKRTCKGPCEGRGSARDAGDDIPENAEAGADIASEITILAVLIEFRFASMAVVAVCLPRRLWRRPRPAGAGDRLGARKQVLKCRREIRRWRLKWRQTYTIRKAQRGACRGGRRERQQPPAIEGTANDPPAIDRQYEGLEARNLRTKAQLSFRRRSAARWRTETPIDQGICRVLHHHSCGGVSRDVTRLRKLEREGSALKGRLRGEFNGSPAAVNVRRALPCNGWNRLCPWRLILRRLILSRRPFNDRRRSFDDGWGPFDDGRRPLADRRHALDNRRWFAE